MKRYSVKTTMTGEIEFFDTEQEAYDYIASELLWFNIHESKKSAYKEDDFELRDYYQYEYCPGCGIKWEQSYNATDCPDCGFINVNLKLNKHEL